jgi:glycosyltransferase involved in cell wall biosynthesis
VLIVTGIWPPDVGGPASHAPEVASFLQSRGHEVEVLTTAPSAPAPASYPVRWISRRLPVLLRYAWGSVLSARAAAKADVVYSTGMFGRTRVGSLLGRAPRVVKLTGDPAFERAVRYGLTRLPLDGFQRSKSPRILWLKLMRDLVMSGAKSYVCPSDSLRQIAGRWRLVRAERIAVIPNPITVRPPGDRDEFRRRYGFTGPALVFAGRLSVQKSLDVALRALGECEGIELVIAGEGPERESLEALARELGVDGRTRFLGPQPRETVLDLLAAADAGLLSSSWENFPHTVVEALAAGTPVIATDVGGVGEVLTDGVNGLLVPARDPAALAAAIRRYFADGDLRARLRAAAQGSVAGYGPEEIYMRIEKLLREAAS